MSGSFGKLALTYKKSPSDDSFVGRGTHRQGYGCDLAMVYQKM